MFRIRAIFITITLQIAVTNSLVASALTPWTSGLLNIKGQAALPETGDKDKALVIFWGSWCKVCKDKLKEDMPITRNAAVFSVNMDRSIAKAKDVIEREKIIFPVFFDENKSLRKELKVFGVPHWAVYRKDASATGGWLLVEAMSGFEDEKVIQALNK